ncbi:hypothetical protein [Paenibacillus nasutitermitis]|uniref:Uncharacterized protein n=1 Tax=Paenibacillus nasutitermitis TaxID=1652958 RepID=A0A916YLR4_9BACL|nr:hypothetical protein [Paenibacillus nasutitermitis]GGD48819.1 hypothetical protein GCM10010911_02920 [Paenibacillus nasutitermitis]
MNTPKDDELKQLEQELRAPLSQIMTNPVSSNDTTMLIRTLQPAFDELRESYEEERFSHSTHARVKRPSLLRLLRSQLSSYSRVYWGSSLVVFVMLLWLLPTHDNVSFHTVGTMFTLALPALLLASLAYSFRSWNREMRMIESITPYPPALLLVVRTMIVIGLNLIFGLVGSIYMNVRVYSFPMLPFMLQWLSLLLLLSGVTAYVLMWKGFKAAFLCSFILWIGWTSIEQYASPMIDQTISKHFVSFHAFTLAAGLLLLIQAYRRSFGTKLLPQ